MQLIVISHPGVITNEAEIINALFDEGLELFHLRKPAASENELAMFLKKIDINNYSRIAIHHHSMAEAFGIKRIHFSGTNRLKITGKECKKWKAENYILSTSVHSINEYNTLSDDFNYAFLGPVYESISKPGYQPKSVENIQLKKDKNRTVKIIAIGGITANKLESLELANFDGAAMLGAIWKDPKNAIKVLKACQQNVNMY